jgi:hypothetical protein
VHIKKLSSLVKNNCFLLSGSISFKKITVQVVLPGSLQNNRLVYQTLVLLMLLLLFTQINTLVSASLGLRREGGSLIQLGDYSHPLPPPALFQGKKKNTDLHYFMADR